MTDYFLLERMKKVGVARSDQHAAELLGIPRTYIANTKKGTRKLKDVEILKIAELLNESLIKIEIELIISRKKNRKLKSAWLKHYRQNFP